MLREVAQIMQPLGVSIIVVGRLQKYAQLPVVNGAGVFDPAFMAEYLAIRKASVTSYRKFFNLRWADIRFSADELRTLGIHLATGAADSNVTPGPIAILIDPSPPPLLRPSLLSPYKSFARCRNSDVHPK